MASTINRRSLVRWLLDNGFIEEPNLSTSHRHFSKGSLKVSIKGHGPNDVAKTTLGNIIRQLVSAGWSREQLRRELGGGR
jgi:predicted RNA binding protein YcfA (HicA-like mRNA interferase family)